VHESAEKASSHEKAKVGRLWGSRFGGPMVEKLLEKMPLIDARYLVALSEAGAVVPRWQLLPEVAKIGPHNKWRLRCWRRESSLPVLVLSYPWLDPSHPDQKGEQLRKLVPILKLMVAEAQRYGKHATIGVLMDYCCLPQAPRNREEQTLFEAGLSSLHEWYSHPFTHVLLVTTKLPTGAAYSNTRAYHERGWCYMEHRLASLVKNDRCLWDLSAYKGASNFDGLWRQMRVGRTPMTSPERVGHELREGVESHKFFFSYVADLEVVLDQYRRGFMHAFESFKRIKNDGQISHHDLGWGTAEAPLIAEALKYVDQHCNVHGLSLHMFNGNDFGEQGWATLKASVKGSNKITTGKDRDKSGNLPPVR